MFRRVLLPAICALLACQPASAREVTTRTWTENGVPHTAHHMHLLKVEDDQIVEDQVMCGGRWPAARMAEMEAADAR